VSIAVTVKPLRLLIAIAITAIVASFAVYVWPTRYRYDHMSLDGRSDYLVRIDRFSGTAEFLYPGTGWMKMPIR
jgi:hypothetical protein